MIGCLIVNHNYRNERGTMIGYWFVLVVYGITYGLTQNWVSSLCVAAIPWVFVWQLRQGKKEQSKLDALPSEDRKEYEAKIQRERQCKSDEEVRKHETKLRYGTAASIIARFYPHLCKTYYTASGKSIWCNDENLTNKVVRVVNLKYIEGQYQIVDEEVTYARAEKICNTHMGKYNSN
jgi:hypothetical protein